jgi:hypothetical protein
MFRIPEHPPVHLDPARPTALVEIYLGDVYLADTKK